MPKLTLELDDMTIERLMSLGQRRGMDIEQAGAFVMERTLFGVDKRVPATVAEYKPQHIPIMIDDNADGIKKPFRCVGCGNVVFYYYGKLKLITNGIYDAKSMLIEGEEHAWSENMPAPTEHACQGRVMPEGYSGKVRCGYIYYKIGS